MWRSASVLGLSGVLLAACAAPASSPAGPPDPTDTVLPTFSVSEEEGPRINWDIPIPNGIMVPAGEAQRLGQLPFEPVLPEYSLPPVRVVVTDPESEAEELRAVTYVYDFSSRQGFTDDGRVRVLEGVADFSDELFGEVVASHEGFPDAENYDVITIAGRDALFIHTESTGRVRFARQGVYFDIAGPALLPNTAVLLAEDLAATVGSK